MSAQPAALVAGGSGGIGFEIARALTLEGYDVTIVGRRVKRLELAADELRATGADASAVPGDLTYAHEVDRVVAAHRQRVGRLDALVNSAGYGGPRGPIETISVEKLDRIIALDLRATELMTRACIPMLGVAGAEHGKALVVNVASVAGKLGLAGIAAYSAAKGGTIAFGRAMAAELAASGVRVTTLIPGYVDTPMADWIEDVPKAEMLRPADLAEAVRLLLRLSRWCHVPEIQLARRTGEV